MVKKQAPVVSTRERKRLNSDYYLSDTNEFQTFSQDSEFVRTLREAHRL